MVSAKEEMKRKEFRDILIELSKNQDFLKSATCRSNMYRRLEALYDAEPTEEGFRHYYSDIFAILVEVKSNPDLGDINILGQNLDALKRKYKVKNKAADGKRLIDVSGSIRKLYDHVNLDIARIAYSDATDKRAYGESTLKNLQGEINYLQGEIPKAKEIQEDYENTEKKISEVESKLESSQREYIAILGIFAAVVLAFTGGIAFSTSVLNNVAKASIYRTVTVSLIIGLVLINVLFGLFYYINLLVNKNKRLLPLIVSNVVILILLLGTRVAWNCGMVEKRAKRITTQVENIHITIDGDTMII